MKEDKRRPEDDPRYQRVRRSLHDAVLRLSAKKPVDEVSVAELTNLAGVHRTSFYAHASSPSDLLVAALVAEMEPGLRMLHSTLQLEETDYSEYWQNVYTHVLSHVREREGTYRQIVIANSAVLVGLYNYFADHVSASLAVMMSSWKNTDFTPLWLEMARQQQAHNLMAVIMAWVATDLRAPIPRVVEAYWTLAPPWQLAKKGTDGMVEMYRRATDGSTPASVALAGRRQILESGSK